MWSENPFREIDEAKMPTLHSFRLWNSCLFSIILPSFNLLVEGERNDVGRSEEYVGIRTGILQRITWEGALCWKCHFQTRGTCDTSTLLYCYRTLSTCYQASSHLGIKRRKKEKRWIVLTKDLLIYEYKDRNVCFCSCLGYWIIVDSLIKSQRPEAIIKVSEYNEAVPEGKTGIRLNSRCVVLAFLVLCGCARLANCCIHVNFCEYMCPVGICLQWKRLYVIYASICMFLNSFSPSSVWKQSRNAQIPPTTFFPESVEERDCWLEKFSCCVFRVRPVVMLRVLAALTLRSPISFSVQWACHH